MVEMVDLLLANWVGELEGCIFHGPKWLKKLEKGYEIAVKM
jgi:hypothetical protein